MSVCSGAEQEHDAVARPRPFELLVRVLGSDSAADHGRRRPDGLDLLPHLVIRVEGARRERPDLDVIGAEQPRQLGEDTGRDRHRAAAAQERRAHPMDEDREAVLAQPGDRAEPGEERVDHQRTRSGLDDRVGVGAGDVRRVEDVSRDRVVDRVHTLGRRPLQLVVLDENRTARGEFRGDGSRILGSQTEGRLDDGADRDAGRGGKCRSRQPLRPVHLDEPARLHVAAIGPLACDARREQLLGARLPVEGGEVDRHALALDVHHPSTHVRRPVAQAHRLEDRQRLAPGRRQDFVDRAHPRIVGPCRGEGGFRWQ